MLDYKDFVYQLKYPGASRCMSRLYEAVNMDYVRYSENSASSNRMKKTGKNIPNSSL